MTAILFLAAFLLGCGFGIKITSIAYDERRQDVIGESLERVC